LKAKNNKGFVNEAGKGGSAPPRPYFKEEKKPRKAKAGHQTEREFLRTKSPRTTMGQSKRAKANGWWKGGISDVQNAGGEGIPRTGKEEGHKRAKKST